MAVKGRSSLNEVTLKTDLTVFAILTILIEKCRINQISKVKYLMKIDAVILFNKECFIPFFVESSFNEVSLSAYFEYISFP